MKIARTKINVALGALTGLLVGFVFGAAFGTPAGVGDADGSAAAGNVAKISQIRKSMIQPNDKPVVQVERKDTLSFASKDEDGKDIQVIIIKEKQYED